MSVARPAARIVSFLIVVLEGTSERGDRCLISAWNPFRSTMLTGHKSIAHMRMMCCVNCFFVGATKLRNDETDGCFSFFVSAFGPSSLVVAAFADFFVMPCLVFRCDVIGEDVQHCVLFSAAPHLIHFQQLHPSSLTTFSQCSLHHFFVFFFGLFEELAFLLRIFS